MPKVSRLTCWAFFASIASLTMACGNSHDNIVQRSAIEVGHADILLPTRHSERVALHVSYPFQKQGTYPLIIFSHAHYLTNRAYDNLTDKWVAQGFIVVAPQHIDTGDWAQVQELTKEVGRDWITAARILDMKAILHDIDIVTASIDSFHGKVSTENVIVAGHALGALSAQLIAGAFFERQQDSRYPIPDTLRDPRVAAVIAISPLGLVPDYLSRKTWEGFNTPQLVVTGTHDTFEHIWQDYREHFVSYEAAEPGDNYLLVVDGMDHYMGSLIGRLDRQEAPQWQALEHVAEQSVRFMQHYLPRADSARATSTDRLPMRVSPTTGIAEYEHR